MWLSTPAEWLAALLQSHSFTFEGQGQKQRVLGRRKATITDPLVPARCELVLDEGRQELLALRLFWAPVAVAAADDVDDAVGLVRVSGGA